MSELPASIPEIPDLALDRAFISGTDLPGPEAIMRLGRDCSELIRDFLSKHAGCNPHVLDVMRFESLVWPYLFEARRIGDARGQFRERTPWAALYPGTE